MKFLPTIPIWLHIPIYMFKTKGFQKFCVYKKIQEIPLEFLM